MAITQVWRTAASCTLLATGLLLASCTPRPAPPAVVAVARPVPPPDPAALHKAFASGYAAGYAAAKRVQARLDEQLKSQPAATSPSQALANQPVAANPVNIQPFNSFAVDGPAKGINNASSDAFRQTGQATPVDHGN